MVSRFQYMLLLIVINILHGLFLWSYSLIHMDMMASNGARVGYNPVIAG